MWLTRLAIKRPITATMLLVSLLVLGGISILHLPLNFLPNEQFPSSGCTSPTPTESRARWRRRSRGRWRRSWPPWAG